MALMGPSVDASGNTYYIDSVTGRTVVTQPGPGNAIQPGGGVTSTQTAPAAPLPSSSNGGGGGGQGANIQAAQLLLNQAQQAAYQAYLTSRLGLDTDELAFKKATQAFNNTISAAGVTGYYNGEPTLARESEQNRTMLGLLSTLAGLRGPADPFQYLRTLQGTPQGLRDIVNAAAGRYQLGTAVSGEQSPRATLGGLIGDITGGGGTGGVGAAGPGAPGAAVGGGGGVSQLAGTAPGGQPLGIYTPGMVNTETQSFGEGPGKGEVVRQGNRGLNMYSYQPGGELRVGYQFLAPKGAGTMNVYDVTDDPEYGPGVYRSPYGPLVASAPLGGGTSGESVFDLRGFQFDPNRQYAVQSDTPGEGGATHILRFSGSQLQQIQKAAAAPSFTGGGTGFTAGGATGTAGAWMGMGAPGGYHVGPDGLIYNAQGASTGVRAPEGLPAGTSAVTIGALANATAGGAPAAPPAGGAAGGPSVSGFIQGERNLMNPPPPASGTETPGPMMARAQRMGPTPTDNTPGFGGGGADYNLGAGATDPTQALAGLPLPNQIDPQNYSRMNPSQRAALWAAYEYGGPTGAMRPEDAQFAFQQSLPKYRPTYGRVNLLTA